jgi:hypothetical protein
MPSQHACFQDSSVQTLGHGDQKIWEKYIDVTIGENEGMKGRGVPVWLVVAVVSHIVCLRTRLRTFSSPPVIHQMNEYQNIHVYDMLPSIILVS